MNPAIISKDDCPLIFLSDFTSGPIEFVIKFRTKGNYNHAMWMPWPREFASQGWTYSLVKLDRYMKRNNRLKAWAVKGLTPVLRKLLVESITKKLARPWWKKRYDFLGILGQAIGLDWLNTPYLDFCSEDVALHLKYVADKGLNDDNPLKKVIQEMPKHGSPEDINEYFKKHSEHFEVFGKWEGDDRE